MVDAVLLLLGGHDRRQWLGLHFLCSVLQSGHTVSSREEITTENNIRGEDFFCFIDQNRE
jgi:hypothetical protein